MGASNARPGASSVQSYRPQFRPGRSRVRGPRGSGRCCWTSGMRPIGERTGRGSGRTAAATPGTTSPAGPVGFSLRDEFHGDDDMTATALVTVLAAAVFHALWNTAAKSTQGDSTVFVWMYFTGGALLCAPLVVIQMLREDHAYGWELLLAPAVTAGFHIAYSLLLQTGYRRADMGVVYPVARGTGPLLAVTVAVLALGERLEPLALLGGVAIVAGILVVTGRSLFRRASSLATGLFYGVATGVAIAAYTLWDDFSVNALGITPIVYFGLASTAQSLLMLPWVLRRRDQLAPTWAVDKRQVIVVAVLSPLAYILVLYALTTTSVALVAPIRGSSSVLGALLSWWLVRERDPLRRVVGAGIVAAGIALMVRGWGDRWGRWDER